MTASNEWYTPASAQGFLRAPPSRLAPAAPDAAAAGAEPRPIIYIIHVVR
jgi:hypothetical protein